MTRMALRKSEREFKVEKPDRLRYTSLAVQLSALGSTLKKLHQEEMKSTAFKLLYLLERNGG